MEPRFYGFWVGLFSIGLNWIFVALVCRQLFCVGLSLPSPCIDLSLDLCGIGFPLSRFALWVRRHTVGCA